MGACFSAGGFVTDPHGAARERYNRELEETSSTLTVGLVLTHVVVVDIGTFRSLLPLERAKRHTDPTVPHTSSHTTSQLTTAPGVQQTNRPTMHGYVQTRG
jgi:hypothetical protein